MSVLFSAKKEPTPIIIARLARCVFEHQVKMIGHQNEGVEDPPRTLNGRLQPADESLPVRVIANDVLPGIAPGHDVVNRISILDLKWTTPSADSTSAAVSSREKT